MPGLGSGGGDDHLDQAPPPPRPQTTVNARAVRILLEWPLGLIGLSAAISGYIESMVVLTGFPGIIQVAEVKYTTYRVSVVETA